MTIELGRRLLSSGALPAQELHIALFAHLTSNTHFLHALILRGAIDEATLDQEAQRSAIPTVSKVVPNLDLVARLPRGLCASLLAVPLRVDRISAVVDVAAADPFDTHVAAELAFHLQSPVRVAYARVSLIDEAISEIERALGQEERLSLPFSPDNQPKRTETPAFGSVTAAIALQAARRSSDMPIPLVRRSQAPKPVPFTSSDPREQDASRITRDAIVLDPDAIAAAVATRFTAHDVDDLARGSLPRPPIPPTFTAVPAPRVDAISLDEALASIEQAASRDAVVRALLRGMLSCAGRVAVFAVRRDAFLGWACSQDVALAKPFREVVIPRGQPSALSDACEKGWFLGDPGTSEADRILVSLFDPPADEISIVAVRLSGRPAMLIVADRLTDTMIATRTADRLARSAAAALLRILRTDKLHNR